MSRATSIRVFLADGTPDGIRLVEKSNWTGRAIVASRTQLSDALKRTELAKPGVYVLTGTGENPERARRWSNGLVTPKLDSRSQRPLPPTLATGQSAARVVALPDEAHWGREELDMSEDGGTPSLGCEGAPARDGRPGDTRNTDGG